MNDMTTLLPYVRLHLNLKYPNLEDCYSAGYDAACAESLEEENPYPAHTRENEQWLEGWWAGFYGEVPLYVAEGFENLELLSYESPAANDHVYGEDKQGLFARMMELTGLLAVSSVLGYQLLDLVA